MTDVNQCCERSFDLPEPVQLYLAHVEDGTSIRSLARAKGCHASTVLRQVRRYEQRRDDPLIDTALKVLGRRPYRRAGISARPGTPDMHQTTEISDIDARFEAEARHVLSRLAEPAACLAVAEGMDMAVVVRDTGDGEPVRTAAVASATAQNLALRDWIAPASAGRIRRYRITPAGRVALNALVAASDPPDAGADSQGNRRGQRYGIVETPLAMLARRRDRCGAPFLTPDQVRVAERLREDYELAEMAAPGATDWSLAVSAGDADRPAPVGFEGAAHRLGAALSELGPGLGDVVFRVCCRLEGLEEVEKRMGWAARSGKIVLRLALDRLVRRPMEDPALDLIG